MKRYFVTPSGPVEDSQGPYVDWDEIEIILFKLEEEIASLKEMIDKFKNEANIAIIKEISEELE